MKRLENRTTPWSNFVKASGFEKYRDTTDMPTLTAEEKEEVMEAMEQLFRRYARQFYEAVKETASHFTEREIWEAFQFNTRLSPVTVYAETFHITSLYLRSFAPCLQRKKPTEVYEREYSGEDMYRAVRSMQTASVQRAFEQQPCDIRCTTNDIYFLQSVKKLPDSKLDRLRTYMRALPDVVTETLDTMEKEDYRAIWKTISPLSDFTVRYGKWQDYSGYRMKALHPSIQYLIQDRARQDHKKLWQLFTLRAAASKYSQAATFLQRYPVSDRRTLFLSSISSNIGLDELFLTNPARDGYGRLYLRKRCGTYWELEEEEREWVSLFRPLSLQRQEQIIREMAKKKGEPNLP